MKKIIILLICSLNFMFSVFSQENIFRSYGIIPSKYVGEWRDSLSKVRALKASVKLKDEPRFIGGYALHDSNSSIIVVVKDTTFVYQHNYVYCFNNKTGKKYWANKYKHNLGRKIWNSKSNIVVTDFKKLQGINKKTGELAWTYKESKLWNRLYNTKNGHIILSKDSVIVGLDAESGKKVWEYKHSIPLYLLITHDNNKLLGKRRDSLYCINIINKKTEWKKKIEKCRKINSSNNQILFDTRNDSIIKLNLENGKFLMRNSAKGQSNTLNLLSTSRGIIAKVIGKEEIFLWDVKSGKTIWTYKIPNQETLQIPYSRPIAADKKTLYINTKQGILRAIHLKTGKLLWEFNTCSRVTSKLILNDGILHLINVSGQVLIIDTNLKDGTQKWKNVRDF